MIFLDVGAHEGQTLAEAVRYRFDEIHAYEPMPREFALIQQRYGTEVSCHHYGLADSDDKRTMYGRNDLMEASIYPGKEDVDTSVQTTCAFRRASTVIEEMPDGPLFVKLNCEGAEIPILADLVYSGAIHQITSLLVDFDASHVEGMEDEEDEIRWELLDDGYNHLVTSPDVVPKGHERKAEGTYRYTRADEIMCWLKSHGIAER